MTKNNEAKKHFEDLLSIIEESLASDLKDGEKGFVEITQIPLFSDGQPYLNKDYPQKAAFTLKKQLDSIFKNEEDSYSCDRYCDCDYDKGYCEDDYCSSFEESRERSHAEKYCDDDYCDGDCYNCDDDYIDDELIVVEIVKGDTVITIEGYNTDSIAEIINQVTK